MNQSPLQFWSKEIENSKISLFLGFSAAVLYMLIISINAPLLAAMDITLIPTTGEVGKAFKSGDFSFTIILLFGMHLIKLGGILSGVVYMIMNVYAGIVYITGTAAGNKDAGKEALIGAFQGFALVALSWIMVDLFITFITN